MSLRFGTLLLFSLFACSEQEPVDDGPAGQSCAQPDTECPAEGSPIIGGPCEGALSCGLVDADGFDWTYECEGGQWVASGGCRYDEEWGEETCQTPPLAERCAGPFDGSLEGAIVRIGPGDVASPFRRFEPEEETDMVIGPQGGAMVSVRLEIVGIEVPACVGVHATMRLVSDEDETYDSAIPLSMHCERSNPFFLIVPANCDGEDTTVAIDVDVDGIGSTSATLRVPAQANSCG